MTFTITFWQLLLLCYALPHLIILTAFALSWWHSHRERRATTVTVETPGE